MAGGACPRLPLILSTGSWAVQHFVDRMFLTWYSPEAIAAAMPAGILNFTLMSFFIGTASYVSTFVAQYHGAGMRHRIGPVLWQGIYFSMLGGVLVLCLIPLAAPVFDLVGHDEAVRRNEIVYFQVLCLGGSRSSHRRHSRGSSPASGDPGPSCG